MDKELKFTNLRSYSFSKMSLKSKSNYLFYFVFIGSIILFCSYYIVKISGIVSFDGNPLPGALIKLQGTDFADTSDNSGHFQIDVDEIVDSIILTAWKDSFYIAGLKVSSETDEITFSLERITHPDNPEYKWIHPDSVPDPGSCVNCHAEIVTQWSENLHSKASTDPMVLSMYNGTDAQGNPGIYPGYKLDFPGSEGSCANCHAPTAALKHGSWLTDLNEVVGVDLFGVHCDYCHKIAEVVPDFVGSKPGFLSNSLWRPYPERQLFLGSFKDSPGDDTYLSVFEKSRYCAGCHNYYNNNTPIYTSYQEWATSPYPKRGVECQDCHMEPNGTTTNFAPGKGGAIRMPGTIPSHNQMGDDLEEFLSQSVEMEVATLITDSALFVSVKIANDSTGHHFPTGNPIRNAILIVRAYDENGQELEYIGSTTIPFWGGEGNDDNDYAHLPGKGFARILSDFKGNSPAPQWELAYVESDTRIPADRIDSSKYEFKLPDEIKKVVIDVKFIYRKSFKELSDVKKWNLEDYQVARDSFLLNISDDNVSSSYHLVNEKAGSSLKLYPNPCYSELSIDFTIGRNSLTAIHIVNSQGQIINELLNQTMHAGDYSISWNLIDANGDACNSGHYYLIFKTPYSLETRKIVILK